MSLYFETEMQSISFLLLCAVGFVIASLFDGISALIPDKWKILGDVLLFLVGTVAFLLALVILREGALRFFHWLALLAGAILYTCGVRRAVLFLLRQIRKRKRSKPPAMET